MQESFKDFLLKNSVIEESFLIDFNKLINENYFELYNEFVISSNYLEKWLQIKDRQEFHNTIRRSYKENIDYKSVKVEKEGRGGHNKIEYMMTPECVKMILQATKSKKGNQVRKYFIEIERVLYKYKNYIIEGLNQKIKQLERNQKPKINPGKKIIYVFKALNTDLTLYKIGKTINSKTRFNSHNSPLANDIKILYQYETDNIDQVESCIKAHLKTAQYRKYKEIYQVDLDIIKNVIQTCGLSIKSANKKINKEGGLKQDLDNEQLYMLIPNDKFTNTEI
jgi:phage anti-repressor protein